MKVKTTGPVQHDGKTVEIGAVIEVSTSAGKQLIEAGAAEEAGKKADAGAEGKDSQ
jgi:hypothetical protein